MDVHITARLEKRTMRHFWEALAKVPALGNKEVEKIAGAARAGVGLNFSRESSPDGTPWAALAPMTEKERASGIDERGVPFRVAPAHPILVRTRDLKRSFTDRGHPRNITHVRRGDDTIQVTLGAQDDPATPDRIATLHSGGKTSTGRLVPARPFVGLSAPAMERVDRTARYVLDERAKRVK
jgi:phage gpG-like protein